MLRTKSVVLLFAILYFSTSIKSLLSQNEPVIDSLSKVLVYEKDPAKSIQIHLLLSKIYEGIDPQKSLEHALEASSIAENNHLKKEKLHAILQVSKGFLRLGKYEESYHNCQLALEIANDLHLKAEQATARNIFSLIYYEIGDFEKSSAMDFENLKYYEQIEDNKQIGIALGNIGINFSNQKDYDKGLEYMKKSFEIALKINDLHGVAYQYNNIAGVYSEFYSDYKTGLDYYRKALDINSKLGDKRQDAIYRMNIAVCHLHLNSPDSALSYLMQAKESFHMLENEDLYAECLSHLGQYYLKKGDFKAALNAAEKAFEIGKQNGFKERVMAAAELQHHIHLMSGDTNKAYAFAMIQHQTKDSIVSSSNQQELFKLEYQYHFEKQEKNRQLAAQRKETIFLVIILGLVSGLAIVLLLFSRHRLKTKSIRLEKESIEKELEFKNKELTINLLSLMKKNEMLSDISNRLTTIEKAAKKEETKDAISKISREIRSNADDKMLNEFTTRFQEVHKGFYEALLAKFPDLSNNELKLCAFLRLNMSSKDISELTGQRLQTIEHARYRLRKKLGISNSETNLSNFLAVIHE